jgi:hypothetical protein
LVNKKLDYGMNCIWNCSGFNWSSSCAAVQKLPEVKKLTNLAGETSAFKNKIVKETTITLVMASIVVIYFVWWVILKWGEHEQEKENEQQHMRYAELNNGKFIIQVKNCGEWKQIYFHLSYLDFGYDRNNFYHTKEQCEKELELYKKKVAEARQAEIEKAERVKATREAHEYEHSIKTVYTIQSPANTKKPLSNLELWNDPELVSLFNTMINTSDNDAIEVILDKMRERINNLQLKK